MNEYLLFSCRTTRRLFGRFCLVAFFLLVVIAPPAIRADACADAFNKGLDAYNRRDYESAIVDFTEAIRLNPNYAAAYTNRGNAYRAKGDNDRAIRLHQDFKFKVVACWPEGERWWITAEQIAAVVKVIEQEAVPIANEQDDAAGAASSKASLSTGGPDAA